MRLCGKGELYLMLPFIVIQTLRQGFTRLGKIYVYYVKVGRLVFNAFHVW